MFSKRINWNYYLTHYKYIIILFSILFIIELFIILKAWQTKIIVYRANATTCNSGFNASKIQQISEQPRIFYYPNFLSDEECDYVIRRGIDLGLSRSVLGSQKVSDHRTSKGAWLAKGDKVLRLLEKRVADFTQIPIEHQEIFYLLRYENGEQYKPHYDSTRNKNENGGRRIMTVLIYAGEPTLGGNTTFPIVDLAIKPDRGSAILFHSITPDYEFDEYALHAGEPVIEGVKWCLTKWIHERPYMARNALPQLSTFY